MMPPMVMNIIINIIILMMMGTMMITMAMNDVMMATPQLDKKVEI